MQRSRASFSLQPLAAGRPTPMSDEFHISSLVVQVLPAKVQFVQEAIARLGGTEINAVTDGGRIVVTLETNSEAEFLMRFAEIDRLPGVVSAMLVFHQVESVGSG
jgi:periplasmic nitrate reductase NapD